LQLRRFGIQRNPWTCTDPSPYSTSKNQTWTPV